MTLLDIYNSCKRREEIIRLHEKFMELGEATAQGFQAGINQEEPTMKVSYNGFTGELVKLEQIKKMSIDNCISSNPEGITVYNISIYDAEKKVTHSFTNVNLKDVKFLGGSVSFE